MKNWLLLLLALPLLFIQCRKDIDELTITDTSYQLPVVVVTSTLAGQVIGADRQGIAGVAIRVGNLTTTTDERGYFLLRDARVNARGTYIRADKAGYFPGSDRLYPLNGGAHFSTIQLLPQAVAGLFSAAAGGTVSMEGASVEFPAGAIADAQGNPYAGQVTVMGRWLDPAAPDLHEFMPGNLFGLRTDGRPAAMATFGMLAVELYGAAGQPLQMAQGQQATLRIQVPADLRTKAPAQIPLWHFDEAAGVWIEEGSANLQDGQYVGQVSHFTYWNLDVPTNTPLVFVSGCVVLPDGSPVANVSISVVNADNGLTYVVAQTDAAGQFGGLIPSGVPLVFRIADQCGFVQSFTVSPLSSDIKLECFVINASSTLAISGQVVGCDGQGIANAAVSIQYAASGYAHQILSDATGQFSTAISTCASLTSASITAYDISNLSISEPQTHDLTNGDVSLGEVAVCDNPLEEYFVSVADGITHTYILPSLTDSLGTNYTIQGFTDDQSGFHVTVLGVPSISVGTYTGTGLSFYTLINMPPSAMTLVCPDACDSITLTITANGGPGGFLVGEYVGTIDTSESIPVSGHFRIRIQ